MGNCKVTLAGREVGAVCWQRHNARCHVSLSCRFEPGVFYRATLEGDGEEIPLGLLVQEGERFVAARWLTAAQSRRLEEAKQVRCHIQRTPMENDETEPQEPPAAPEASEPIPDQRPRVEPPGRLLEEFFPLDVESISDPLLKRLAGERKGLLQAEDLLAMPALEEQDPMAPFFCMMHPASCGTERWYLLPLQDGCPVSAEIGQKSQQEGDTLDWVMT